MLTMITIIVSMTLAMAVFAAALALKSPKRDQGVFFALFLGLYAIVKLDELTLMLGGYSLAPHALGLAFSVKLFLAPCIYFYSRSLMSSEARWIKRSDWPALITPILAIIMAVPFYILPPDQKIGLLSPELRDPDLYANALLGCQIGLVLFIISSLAYLYATHKIFRSHDRSLREMFSRIDDKTASWLCWVIIVLALGWSVHALTEILALSGYRAMEVLLAYQFFEMLWIGLIAFCGITQQPMSLEASTKQTSTAPRPSLDEARMTKIANRLDQAMQQQRLFENPDLSLRDLSDALNVSENQLSETFSRHFGRNFFDYVNGYRISFACQLLEGSGDTILTVALDAGFNSRSTFNAAFKKHVGVTPSQYRKHSDLVPVDLGLPEIAA